MNKIVVALTAGLVAAGAYAAGDSTKTRADVKADAIVANQSGHVASGEANLLADAQAKLSKEEMAALRAKLKAEARAANKTGEIARGEEDRSLADAAQAKLSNEEMTAVRASVRTQAKLALKKGEIQAGDK